MTRKLEFRSNATAPGRERPGTIRKLAIIGSLMAAESLMSCGGNNPSQEPDCEPAENVQPRTHILCESARDAECPPPNQFRENPVCIPGSEILEQSEAYGDAMMAEGRADAAAYVYSTLPARHYDACDYENARLLYGKAMEAIGAAEISGTESYSLAYSYLLLAGYDVSSSGDYSAAEAKLLRALEISGDIGSPGLTLEAGISLSRIYMCTGDEASSGMYESMAHEVADELAIGSDATDREISANAYSELGRLSQLRGDHQQAGEMFEAAGDVQVPETSWAGQVRFNYYIRAAIEYCCAGLECEFGRVRMKLEPYWVYSGIESHVQLFVDGMGEMGCDLPPIER